MENKKKCAISEEIGKLLILQMAHELHNHSIYKTIANFFAVKGILKLEEYYKKRASEEYNHYTWVLDYLHDVDYRFNHPSIEEFKLYNNTSSDDNINDDTLFELTLVVELKTTEMINNIVDIAMKESDWQTFNWLQSKLVPEQIEEESISRTAIDIMKTDANILDKAESISGLINS